MLISQVEQVRIEQKTIKYTPSRWFFELNLGRNADVLSVHLIKPLSSAKGPDCVKTKVKIILENKPFISTNRTSLINHK